MDVTADSGDHNEKSDEQPSTDATSGNSVNAEADDKIDDQQQECSTENGSNGKENKQIETTQLFKDFVSNIKNEIDKAKNVPPKPPAETILERLERIRRLYPPRIQKARKSTNPVWRPSFSGTGSIKASDLPFFLFFDHKSQSNDTSKSNEDDDNKTEAPENNVQIKKEIIDEMLENNSIKIVTENDIQGSSDAVLELTFDEPMKKPDDKEPDEVVKIKTETINDNMFEHNSIKILTENDQSSDAILELTFDEPKKTTD